MHVVVDYPADRWPYSNPVMIQNSTQKFLGTDSQVLFESNLEILPSEWMYRDLVIEYRINKDGLRMDNEIKDVVHQDYLYFSGTSFGMGVGVNLEDTIPYKIGKALNLNFINSSGTTFSNKVQTINFFNFLKKDIPLPKLVIFDWAPLRAYSFMANNKMLYYCGKHLAKDYENQYRAFKLLRDTDTFLMESTVNRNMIMTTCKRLGIKYLEVSFWKDEFTFDNNLPLIDVDLKKDDLNYTYSRDVNVGNIGEYYFNHPGVGLHNEAVEKILERL